MMATDKNILTVNFFHSMVLHIHMYIQTNATKHITLLRIHAQGNNEFGI